MRTCGRRCDPQMKLSPSPEWSPPSLRARAARRPSRKISAVASCAVATRNISFFLRSSRREAA